MCTLSRAYLVVINVWPQKLNINKIYMEGGIILFMPFNFRFLQRSSKINETVLFLNHS